MRLFCFPHAGAGTLPYRSWSGSLEGVAVCPALLPGRETRLGEPALDNMRQLIDALTVAIKPFLDVPFAFFGHSMGAGMAFELARYLRRAGAPGPGVLVVSAARAPQLRVHQPGPEPSDEELMDELQRLHGGERQILELALPALRADTRLYRNYRYEPEPPLSIPIFAYGGATDPSIRPEHLDGWHDQTTGSFTRREFPGGHFYLQTERAMFLASLNEDLQAGVTRDS
ncbi:MAG: thioesterase domain-containing protein [Acidobacteriota bacterium]|nr:thioesterase domain-containing protein [Acidobacteriota bacterium]